MAKFDRSVLTKISLTPHCPYNLQALQLSRLGLGYYQSSLKVRSHLSRYLLERVLI